MRLNSLASADNEHRTVKHRQRSLSLGGKIDVSGSVEQDDVAVPEVKARGFREYGNAAFPLKLVRVEKCISFVHSPLSFNFSREIQHPLRQRCFARVDMSDYPDNSLFHLFLQLTVIFCLLYHFREEKIYRNILNIMPQ